MSKKSRPLLNSSLQYKMGQARLLGHTVHAHAVLLDYTDVRSLCGLFGLIHRAENPTTELKSRVTVSEDLLSSKNTVTLPLGDGTHTPF